MNPFKPQRQGIGFSVAVGTLLLPILTGCLPHTRVEHPRAAIDLPDHFGAGDLPQRTQDESEDARWWHATGDATLEALIDRAFEANPGMRARWVAVDIARAVADQVRAARYPTIAATGSFGYSRSVSFFGTNESLNASAQLPISYEVDLFARARGLSEAADLDAQAAQIDMEAMALAIAAQVADAWYGIVDANARRAVLEEQLRLNRTFLESVQLRFGEGFASALDLHQQRQQVAATEAQIDALDGELELARHRLASLLGTTAAGLPELPATTDFPNFDAPPSVPVPASAIAHRPDVRAAQRRIEAADWRIGSAIAQRLPSLRLNATPGVTWTRNEVTGGLFPGGGDPTVASGFTFSAGVQLNVPLFDGFAGRAQVERREAEMQQQIEALHQLVLGALIEVETALSAERTARRQLELLETRLELADATLESARERYRSGLSDFLPVLTALQAKQGLELARQNARRAILARRIQVHRALAGMLPAGEDNEEASEDNEDGALRRPARSELDSGDDE